MSGSRPTVGIRISAEGAEKVRRELEALGPAGQKAFETIRLHLFWDVIFPTDCRSSFPWAVCVEEPDRIADLLNCIISLLKLFLSLCWKSNNNICPQRNIGHNFL